MFGFFSLLEEQFKKKKIINKKEINFLFSLLETFLKEKINDINEQKIKLKIIGKKNFASNLNKLLKLSEEKTSNNKRLQINLAVNYGSQSELIDAFKELKKNKEVINKKNLNLPENPITDNLGIIMQMKI